MISICECWLCVFALCIVIRQGLFLFFFPSCTMYFINTLVLANILTWSPIYCKLFFQRSLKLGFRGVLCAWAGGKHVVFSCPNISILFVCLAYLNFMDGPSITALSCSQPFHCLFLCTLFIIFGSNNNLYVYGSPTGRSLAT